MPTPLALTASAFSFDGRICNIVLPDENVITVRLCRDGWAHILLNGAIVGGLEPRK